MKSPLATITEKFETKAKLVEALEAVAKNEDLWVSRLNTGKGLAHVSNAKLLKLHATFAAVKEKFGTRAKMIDAIADIEKRAKDEGYKSRLSAYPVPRLWDMYRSVEKRAAAAVKSKEKKPAAKKVAPAAKAAAATKAPAKAAAKKASAKKSKKK